MAFPADVKLVSVTCGTGYDFSGDPIAITLEVTPVLGGSLKRLIHAATGTFMTRDALTFKSDPGSPATFTVPSPAQAETWKDGSGAFFTNWSYSVTVTTRTASGKTQSWIQSFQPVDGQETVDLDLVPDGQIGSPTSAPAPAVTSVNGQSGAVVIDVGEAVTPESVAANLTVEAVDAKLPERLSESALSSAIVESLTGVNDVHRAIEQSNIPILQTTKSTLAYLQNRDATKRIRAVQLLTGDADVTPSNFGNQTVTHGSIEDRVGWKVESLTGATCRLDVTGLDFHPGPVNAVAMWVYITNPAVTTSVQIIITGPTGTWSKVFNSQGTTHTGKPLVRGWNFIRMSASSINTYMRLHDVTGVSVRFTQSAPTANWVGAVDVETRLKATALIVDDWGSKPFYDVAYPDMKARGWPVIWAPRTERFGEANYPDNMTTLEEVKTLMGDGNGNEVSYHSPDGSATLNLTPAEARQNVIDALVGLKVHGVYTDGALWRAAWVQNMAPGAGSTHDLMVCSATPNDRYHNTPWPSIDRYDIPRIPLHGYNFQSFIDIMRDTHSVGVFYTHAVTPNGGGNHASQAEWDAFVAALDVGESEGWLEVINMGTLLRNEPVERTGDEIVTQAGSGSTPVPDPDPVDPDPVTTEVWAAGPTPVPNALGGNTYTHAGEYNGHTAWKVETANTIARIGVTLPTVVTAPGTPQSVVALVYVAEPSAVTTAEVRIVGTGGTWVRTSNQSGSSQVGQNLVQGWNEIRFDANSSVPSYLAGATSVDVRVNVTPPTTVYVGPIRIESIP